MIEKNVTLFGGFGCEEIKFTMCKTENEECEKIKLREFLYQQAINAYQFHVNRYHTWMNYYSIFTGALFVGFCSLNTATNQIEEGCKMIIDQCCCSRNEGYEVYTVTNDYFLLIITICILGLISSICWLLSLCGHEKWEHNWMKNIEYYEDKEEHEEAESDKSYKSLELYKVINGDKNKFNVFSTHTITKLFISGVIIGWVFCLSQIFCNKYCGQYCSILCCIISIVLILTFFMIVIFFCRKGRFYSDVTSKISRLENTNNFEN